MPLGTTPYEIPVPVGGWRTDLPLHRSPDNILICQSGLLYSYNTFVDFDGLLKPRLGYEVINDFGERIVGGISWKDSDGGVQIVVATYNEDTTTGKWWVYQGGWVEILGSAGVSAGGSNPNLYPTRFAVFGRDAATGKDVLYGTNGVDSVHRWVLSDPPAAFSDVTVTQDQSAPGNSLAALDLLVVENRLVFVGTTEAGTRYPQRLRWTTVLGTNPAVPAALLPSLPALAYNDLLDGDAGAITAARLSSRTTAVAYTENGPPWVFSGQYGTSDAQAFAFDRIMDGQAGPINATSIVNVGGRHFYVAGDRHLYASDGNVVQPISLPIDGFLSSASGLVTGPTQRPVAVWDKSRQKVWFFVALKWGGDTEAYHGLCLDLRRSTWDPPQVFPDAFTAAFPILEQFGPTWDSPGIHAQSALTVDIDDTQTFIGLDSGVGFSAAASPVPGIVGDVRIGNEYITYTNVIIYTPAGGSPEWRLIGCTRGAYGTTAAPHVATTVVRQYYSWNTAPWTSWDQVPSDFEPAVYVGTKDGLLCRFFSSSTDRTQVGSALAIPWSAMWGLINPGPQFNIQANGLDILINPQPNLIVPGGDEFTAILEALDTPYDPAPRSVISGTGQSDDSSTWFLQPDRTKIGRGAHATGNYMRFRMSGNASKNGPWFAGTYFYLSENQRPDRVRLNSGGGS